MTLQQPSLAHHIMPWWLELVGAAIIGAAILLGVLLIAGHTDIIPTFGTTDQAQVTWMTPELQQFRQAEILGQ